MYIKNFPDLGTAVLASVLVGYGDSSMNGSGRLAAAESQTEALENGSETPQDSQADQESVPGGVGISVMKAFSGGQLLDDKTSPFGKALTEYQCIQYALDKPAGDCIGCGHCNSRCPFHVDREARMERIREYFERK